MKQVLQLILLSVLSFDLCAQPSTFLKSYNHGNSGYAVREVNGNSYVVAGGTDFYYNYHWMQMSSFATTNVHLFKTDVNGNLAWEKIYGNNNSRTIGLWMEPVTGGGYIITGDDSKETLWPPDSNDVMLIKTDANGVIAWSKIYDTGKDELGFCVRETFDGGFIVSGFHDAAPVSLVGTTYALLIKTDANGNISWSKKYQIAVRDFDTGEALPCVVRQTADSGYVLVGTTSGAHQADIFVVRTNSSGNVLWSKSYEHDNSMFRLCVGLDITETASGDFIIAASLDKDRPLMQFNYPCILKISTSGILINAKLYDSNPVQMFQSGFSSVEEIPGNGFFFSGMGGYGGFGTQAQLLKTDSNLNMEWSRNYTWDGIATMGSRSGRHTSDGSFIFTGKKQNAGSVLMKTNSLGLIPCKSPGVLVELTPSFNTVNRVALTLSGINASVFLLNTQISLVDTTTLCQLAPATLSVELLSFSAEKMQNRKVNLKWETASENNCDFFRIEKCTDGIHFNEAGIVHAAGYSRRVLTYAYIDNHFETSDLVYYRLAQVDFDGSTVYSKTVAVRFNSLAFELISFSVDMENKSIRFIIQSNTAGPVTYTITDMLGRIMINGNRNQPMGISLITIDASGFSNGMYYLTVGNHEQNLTSKILY